MFDKQLRILQQKLTLQSARILSLYFTANSLTLIGFICGLISSCYLYHSYTSLGFTFFLLNRAFDLLDGPVARYTSSASDFGGYLDILTDFTIYSLIPISITFSNPTSYTPIILAFLLSTYFVNSAGLFQLSAILEKRNQGAKNNKEFTSVAMPDGLIEGFETFMFYCGMILMHDYKDIIFLVFGTAVCFNIVQRLRWAYLNIK